MTREFKILIGGSIYIIGIGVGINTSFIIGGILAIIGAIVFTLASIDTS